MTLTEFAQRANSVNVTETDRSGPDLLLSSRVPGARGRRRRRLSFTRPLQDCLAQEILDLPVDTPQSSWAQRSNWAQRSPSMRSRKDFRSAMSDHHV